MTMPSDFEIRLTPIASEPATAGGSRHTAATSDRMAQRLVGWKQRLLDLTKRNRALNFKVQKVATVTVVDEQPAEVYRQLCLHGGSMRFKPTLPSKETEGEAATPQTALDGQGAPEDEEDGALEQDFAPYDPQQLDARHTDDLLQCAATPELLDKSLRRLDEQARSTIEEQGVNALYLALGMLQYHESKDSRELFRAPLLLVPVELTRKSARAGYTVKAADEDPMINPTLTEYLRVNYGIVLPDLPEVTEGVDYDLQSFFQGVGEAVSQQTSWRVTTDIYLALFSFQKLVMYKDLEKNGDLFARHRLITQLVTREGGQLIGLPADVRDMELDRDFPPEETFQVVDADSSQLRAIAAVARQHDMVLEGPPGTGKSQTITNLIAQALSVGKSVLFVAEKQAALNVVHARLVAAGLGEFCLELHSTKANKRAVLHEVRAALDASLQRPEGISMSGTSLKRIRSLLTHYVDAVHTPFGVLGMSPYVAYGKFGEVMDAPKLSFGGDEKVITKDALDEVVTNLTDLAKVAQDVGDPRAHPWRDATATFYGAAVLDDIAELTPVLADRFASFSALAQEVESALAVPPIRTFADVATAAAVAKVLASSPGAPMTVLESPSWNAAPVEATTLVARGRKAAQLRERIAQRFNDEVLDQDHAGDIAFVEQKVQGFFGFLSVLDSRFRSIKRRWLAYRRPEYNSALIDQAADLKSVDEYRRERQALESAAPQGGELFGGLWQGEQSNWEVLESYIRWVVEFRGVCVRHGLSRQAVEVASKPATDVSKVVKLESEAQQTAADLERLRGLVGWPTGYFTDDSWGGAELARVARRVAELSGAIPLAQRWTAFEQVRARLDGTPASGMVKAAMRCEVPFPDLPRAYKRAFLQRWLDLVVGERPQLREFHTRTHEERIAEFRQLDQRVLTENRVTLVGRLRERVQDKLQGAEAAAGMPFLRSEMARQRNLSPLRKTLKHAEGAIRAIKPCFMMSPLSVAQYLDGAKSSFDLIVFDEASQLPSEEAVGAIGRGRQLVVVGDPKQLPPTNFFSTAVDSAAPTTDEDGVPVFQDAESVLEEFMGVGVPVTRLKWHYRSAHESLITFSNVSFYDSDLYTFPSVETGGGEYGLQFEYVPDGVYEGKGLNMAEARRVVDAVVEHAKTRPEESLGVGTFNMRQQLAIQDELELRRRQDPSIEPFFDKGKQEPFFVKNLENIQGDERDVIFLSVTYAKGPDGRLRYNFGPINGENGWRRLNVLTTRAKKRMRVFSSMRGDEINPTTTSSNGPRLLREFLSYAEHGRLDSVMVNAQAATDSPFERDVLTELMRRGYLVDPQVGVAGYRIDLGVRHAELPGRYVLGIECDGVAYHSSETARDRDRLRQQVLESRGWSIIRVWSTDWFKDRAGQVERLVAAIENAKKNAVEEKEAEAESRKRAAELQAVEDAERLQRALASPLGVGGLANVNYERPTAPEYVIAPGQGKYVGSEILDVPLSRVIAAVASVVEVESPVHLADVASRVAGMWGNRLGARISARITEAVKTAVKSGALIVVGDFAATSAPIRVRSRVGTKIPADRVAPEEYQEAVRLVLRAAGSLTRDELITEVRGVLGFGRTAALVEACDAAIAVMTASQELGEGSAGLAQRR
jgi:very-short-patch-repair endonuclease